MRRLGGLSRDGMRNDEKLAPLKPKNGNSDELASAFAGASGLHAEARHCGLSGLSCPQFPLRSSVQQPLTGTGSSAHTQARAGSERSTAITPKSTKVLAVPFTACSFVSPVLLGAERRIDLSLLPTLSASTLVDQHVTFVLRAWTRSKFDPWRMSA